LPFYLTFYTIEQIFRIATAGLHKSNKKFQGNRMKPLSTSRSFLPIFLVCSLFVLAACSAPPGNPEEGKKWFMMHNCSSCHGPHGNDGKAPHIAGLDMGFQSFLRKLRTTDAPIMPPFPESILSKQDAADIYAFLKSSK
jgi:mono/diheme cytochrome c family protein